MELYHKKLVTLGRNLISLIALALNLDEDFFEKVGACRVFMRLLHYPVETSDIMNYGASAHPDYGMITILATDGVRGLQICKEKDKQPRVWEDVLHVNGAFIVNIGDMMERWTNCLFRSTLHRVMTTGQERYHSLFATSLIFPTWFKSGLNCKKKKKRSLNKSASELSSSVLVKHKRKMKILNLMIAIHLLVIEHQTICWLTDL
eukprot:TRINITY_DN410_c0_g1_i1.p1 TRINITY_DN410_c0_g1~~TRINITY_DN410_c0_g1_i1.p1  ORF type:complete len:204 (+),score=27.52 TRINITY_DN410_c0_g1_i1:327-938(+)